MKKIVFGCTLLFLTALVTLYSCSKKDAYWDSVSSQSNTLSVSDAKNWYENQFSGDIADIKSIKGRGKNRLVSYARGVFAGVPDWSHYQKYRNNSNAMTVQLDYPDTGRGYRGFRDLVIVKNNKKQTFNAYVQLEIFNKSYLNEQIKKKGELPDIRSYSDPATFTGSVLLFSVNNEFIRGARYQNGKVVARIFPRNGISGMVSSISNSMHASNTYVAFNGGASVADIEKDNGSKSVAFNKSSQSISYEEPAVRTASSASGDSNDSNDSNDSHDSFDDTHDLGDVTVISTKPNTNNDSWDTDGAHWGDSYPTQTDPTPTNPSTGGGGGGAGNNSGLTNEELAELTQLENDYKDRMSEQELEIYNSMSLYNKFHYLLNAQTASTIAEDNFPTSLWNGKGDAFRHTLFSALNVQWLGLNLATQLGNAHEAQPNENELEKQMDLFNNNIGRTTYYAPGVNPTDYWLLHINDGTLRYISPLNSDGSVIPGVSQLIPTNQ